MADRAVEGNELLELDVFLCAVVRAAGAEEVELLLLTLSETIHGIPTFSRIPIAPALDVISSPSASWSIIVLAESLLARLPPPETLSRAFLTFCTAPSGKASSTALALVAGVILSALASPALPFDLELVELSVLALNPCPESVEERENVPPGPGVARRKEDFFASEGGGGGSEGCFLVVALSRDVEAAFLVVAEIVEAGDGVIAEGGLASLSVLGDLAVRVAADRTVRMDFVGVLSASTAGSCVVERLGVAAAEAVVSVSVT